LAKDVQMLGWDSAFRTNNSRHLLTYGGVGGRVILTYLGHWMLLEGRVYGRLIPMQHGRCNVCPHGPREINAGYWVQLRPKTTSATLSGQKGKSAASFVPVRGCGGEVYKRAMHPRGSDYQCNRTGIQENLWSRKEQR
jgi:hypothetical protein